MRLHRVAERHGGRSLQDFSENLDEPSPGDMTLPAIVHASTLFYGQPFGPQAPAPPMAPDPSGITRSLIRMVLAGLG